MASRFSFFFFFLRQTFFWFRRTFSRPTQDPMFYVVWQLENAFPVR